MTACAAGNAQEAAQLFVADRSSRGTNPGGEELEKAAQPVVVEQCCSLDHAGRRLPVTRCEHLRQRLREVVRKAAHRFECKSGV